MKILVTGGAGFIGSNFVRYILNKYPDYKIINIDKLTYAGNIESLNDIKNNPNFTFVKGDICNKGLVREISKGLDVVINFAAESHVDRSLQDATPFIRTNIHGTETLLEIAKENHIERFIQISTDEVYGSIKEGSFTEKSSLNPTSPYAKSKADADRIVLSSKLPAIITRTTNNFGPYQYPEKFIPLSITNLLEGKEIPVYGDGSNIRDWIYVLDNCSAIDFILHNGKEKEIYNIAGRNEKRNIEVTYMILNYLNRDNIFIKFVEDRPNHDYRYSINDDKLRNLGWQPSFNFKSALETTINWYINNEEWWVKVKKKSEKYFKMQYGK